MIDVENDVFDRVYASVSSLVPEGCFKSVYVPNPSKFPFATLMEMDNVTAQSHRSSALTEEYATLTYEANVYAMDKPTCRSVMSAIDQAMIGLNFARMSLQFVPNLADNTIFRYTARYQAVADTTKTMYRR